jgi:hypothetical protein
MGTATALVEQEVEQEVRRSQIHFEHGWNCCGAYNGCTPSSANVESMSQERIQIG